MPGGLFLRWKLYEAGIALAAFGVALLVYHAADPAWSILFIVAGVLVFILGVRRLRREEEE